MQIEPGHYLDLYGGLGFVKYVDHLGTDQRIVDAARVSYGSPSKGEEADKKLLMYLYRNRHISPFEQCSITFNIKMPIFVMRQFVRHRTFRLNEVSGRYSELPEETYLPNQWRIQDNKNKQGSISVYNSDSGKQIWNEINNEIANQAYDTAFMAYKGLLERGVAKELARIVLPVGVFTEICVNCDIHNLMHFFRLRLDAHAQLEIRDLAKGMFYIFENLFPWVAEAYNRYTAYVVDNNEVKG